MLFITFTQAEEVDLSSLASSYDKEKEFANSLISTVFAPLANNKAWEIKYLGIEPLEKSALYQEIQTQIQNDDRKAKYAMENINNYDVVTQKPFVLSLQLSYKTDYLDSVHQFFSSVGTPCTSSSQTTIRAFDANKANVWCLELPEPYNKILKAKKQKDIKMGIGIGFFTLIDKENRKYNAFRPKFLENDLPEWNVLRSGNDRADTLLSEGKSLDTYFNTQKPNNFFKGIQKYYTIVYLTQEEVKTLKEIRIKALSTSEEGDEYEYSEFMIGNFYNQLLDERQQ